MKNLSEILLEKLRINKDTEVDTSAHNCEYFPFNCIGKEGECFTIGHSGYDWRMLNFRKYMMEIHKKTKYKDILFSLKRGDKLDYLSFNYFNKPRGKALRLDFDIWNKEKIEENGYKEFQNRISSANILNAGIGLDFNCNMNSSDIKNIHISWSDNFKCICINFEAF